MVDHCAQCLTALEENLSYETPRGEFLCGPCYFALWAPRGAHAISRQAEARRPQTTGPQRRRPTWLPGPSGELDPEEPLRRKRG